MIIQVSVLTILFIVLIPAYADSPLAQYNSGVPISGIQCADDKILLQSTSGKPYCMSESTATKLADRGFSLVIFEEIPPVELSETIWSSKDFPAIENTRHRSGGASTYHLYSEIPPIIVEIPHQVKIGEEFVVHVEYTFTSEHFDIHPSFPGIKLFAYYPKQIEPVSTEYIIVAVSYTQRDWYNQHDKYTIMEFPYNELGLNEVDIVFKITEPLPYEDHIFRIGNANRGEIVGSGEMYASSTDDVLTLSPHRPVIGYDEVKYPNRYEEPRLPRYDRPYMPGEGPQYRDLNSLSPEEKDGMEQYFQHNFNMTAPQSNWAGNMSPEIKAEYKAWLESTNQTNKDFFP